MKKFLLSLICSIGVSSTVVANEVNQEVIVLADNTTFAGRMYEHTTYFVERTVNMIATPFLSDKDIECLARNIFYESGAEPTEGKIAVALVTINRTQDGRFGRTVCEVVKARTVVAKTREVKRTEAVKVGYFGRPEPVAKTTVTEQVPVCQFSWVCAGYARKPKPTDERWVESQAIAHAVARGEYEEYRAKYGTALFFHAAGIRPFWAKTKRIVARTGQHIFYE